MNDPCGACLHARRRQVRSHGSLIAFQLRMKEAKLPFVPGALFWFAPLQRKRTRSPDPKGWGFCVSREQAMRYFKARYSAAVQLAVSANASRCQQADGEFRGQESRCPQVQQGKNVRRRQNNRHGRMSTNRERRRDLGAVQFAELTSSCSTSAVRCWAHSEQLNMSRLQPGGPVREMSYSRIARPQLGHAGVLATGCSDELNKLNWGMASRPCTSYKFQATVLVP